MHTTSSNQPSRSPQGARSTTRRYCRAHHAPRRSAHPSISVTPADRLVEQPRTARTRILLGGVASWVLLSAGTVLAWSTLFG